MSRHLTIGRRARRLVSDASVCVKTSTYHRSLQVIDSPFYKIVELVPCPRESGDPGYYGELS
jgi:hypothetical protein